MHFQIFSTQIPFTVTREREPKGRVATDLKRGYILGNPLPSLGKKKSHMGKGGFHLTKYRGGNTLARGSPGQLAVPVDAAPGDIRPGHLA